MLFSSFFYITATTTKITEVIVSSVVILFINTLDEELFILLEKIYPDAVKNEIELLKFSYADITENNQNLLEENDILSLEGEEINVEVEHANADPSPFFSNVTEGDENNNVSNRGEAEVTSDQSQSPNIDLWLPQANVDLSPYSVSAAEEDLESNFSAQGEVGSTVNEMQTPEVSTGDYNELDSISDGETTNFRSHAEELLALIDKAVKAAEEATHDSERILRLVNSPIILPTRPMVDQDSQASITSGAQPEDHLYEAGNATR